MKKLTQEQFIEKAKLIHNNKYNYSQVKYINNNIPVNIICPIHGEFKQTPQNHKKGQGCSKCRSCNLSLRFRSNLIDFIKRANSIHGEKYNYSKFKYINSNTKGTIICSIHGEFLQPPNSHINNKQGCPKCAPNNKLYTETFISKSKIIHGKRYNYSQVEYKHSNESVCIICPIHGIFNQIASDHLQGHGCPKCALEKIGNITISKKQIEFMNHMNIEKRNVSIGKFVVDGMKDNVIYEFLGDYWHGNPKIFNSKILNKHAKKTFGELYKYTFWRFKKLKECGYNIKYIWENDWKYYKQNGIINYV